jgi:hypothetical protein
LIVVVAVLWNVNKERNSGTDSDCIMLHEVCPALLCTARHSHRLAKHCKSQGAPASPLASRPAAVAGTNLAACDFILSGAQKEVTLEWLVEGGDTKENVQRQRQQQPE